MPRKSVVTLKRISEETGLAIATVSRILRRQDQCAAETREKVLAAAAQLGYRPNLLVHALQTGRTRTIGVMVPTQDAFFGRLIAGIHDELVAADNLPLLAWPDLDRPLPTEPGNELQQIHRLVDRRVDGVILYPHADSATDDYLNEVWKRNMPLVAVDHELARSHADFVGTDDALGGRLAAEHLLNLGHRRIAILSGPTEISSSRLRRQGFETAAAHAGGACSVYVEPSFRNGLAGAMELLRRAPRPTALFAVNDHMAVGACEAARELGLRIPENLSVIGFADLEKVSLLRPPLTTLRQNPEEIGREAARLVLARLDGKISKSDPRKVRLPPELIVRGSTAAPATAG